MESRIADARAAVIRHLRRENAAMDPNRLVQLLKADGFTRREIEAALHLAMSRNQIRIDKDMRFTKPGKALQAA